MMRALVEMAYEFDEPFVLDTTKYETTFGVAGTALPTAIAATVAWYRNKATAPRWPQVHQSPHHRTRGMKMSPNDPIRRVSVVSTGHVQIRPDHVSSTWRPMFLWLLTSRQWTAPRPINAYVIEHRDGVVLFDTGQDRVEGYVMKAKRIYNPSRIVALVVIGVMLFGLTYIGFAPGDAAVSVPQGAHAGQLTMHPCTYATEKGALPRGLRHVGRAGEPGRPPVAADRAAGDPDPGSLIAPVGTNLPSQRRPGQDQHDVSPSEPPGRPARCRDGRLPRRRRFFGAELSRGDGGARELRLPHQSVAECVLPGLRLVREAA